MITYGEVVTEDEALSMLLHAGQFAHVSKQQLRHTMNAAFLDAAEDRENSNDMPVTFHMRRMVERGLAPKAFIAGRLLHYVGIEHDAFCVMCGEIHDNCWWTDEDFLSFICPTFTIAKHQTGEWIQFLPLCRPCFKRVKGGKTDLGKIESITKHVTFADRVQKNKDNWTRLRFDPRKPLKVAA